MVSCGSWVVGGCGGNTNITLYTSITPIIGLWVVGGPEGNTTIGYLVVCQFIVCIGCRTSSWLLCQVVNMSVGVLQLVVLPTGCRIL